MSRTLKANRSSLWCISFLILILCWINLGCLAQDDFQDDPGSDGTGNDATNDMLDQDPNTLNPQKNQMSGNNVPSTRSSGKGGPNSANKKDQQPNKTIAEQTLQAALQFGVLVGVALMVGILFMLNVGADLLYTAICDKYTSAFSKHKPVDIEDQDPASLVGSFKRYK